jgi:hypothetical protein
VPQQKLEKKIKSILFINQKICYKNDVSYIYACSSMLQLRHLVLIYGSIRRNVENTVLKSSDLNEPSQINNAQNEAHAVFFFYLVGWDLTPIRSLCRSPRFV